MSLNTVNSATRPALVTGLTATGTSQTTALPLDNNAIHEFTTVAASTGCILPVPKLTTQVTIINAGVSTLAVYPPVGGTITNGTVNASVSLTSGSTVVYTANSLTNWYASSAASSGGSGTVTSVTATGDGVILSATPTAAVMTTGTLTLAQATAATKTILSNTTGGTAAPAMNTLTSIIDTIDATQGDVLYRGSSVWAALAPAASAGALFYSGGSAANPAWTTNILRGTDGNLNFAGVSHASPAAGDLWYPSSDQGTFAIGRASGATRLGGCIFSCGPCTAVANTGSATSIFGTPTLAKGSLTIPANTLAVGNLLRWQLNGTYSTFTTSQTLSFAVILNTVSILSPASVITATAQQTAMPFFSFTGFINIQAIGASATAYGFSQMLLTNSAAANYSGNLLPGGGTPVLTETFASNSNALFDIKLTWGTGNSGNTLQVTSFQLFLDN